MTSRAEDATIIQELEQARSLGDGDLQGGWYLDLPEGSLAPYPNEENLEATLGVVDRMADISRAEVDTAENSP